MGVILRLFQKGGPQPPAVPPAAERGEPDSPSVFDPRPAAASRRRRWASLATARVPETARERRSRNAVEGLLAFAVVVSTGLALREDAVRRGAAPAATSERAWRSIPIDLAHDPPWRLRLLPGVGPSRAAAIARDREAHGPLPSLEALARVPGFGERSVAALSAAGATVPWESGGGPARGPP